MVGCTLPRDTRLTSTSIRSSKATGRPLGPVSGWPIRRRASYANVSAHTIQDAVAHETYHCIPELPRDEGGQLTTTDGHMATLKVALLGFVIASFDVWKLCVQVSCDSGRFCL